MSADADKRENKGLVTASRVMLAVFGLVVGCLANVFAQWTEVAGVDGYFPDFASFWLTQVRERPFMLGLSLGAWPMFAFLAVAVICVAFGRGMYQKVEDRAIDPMLAHGSARFATTEECANYAHSRTEVQTGDGKRKPWPKPEICERLEDDNFILSEHSRIALSKNPVLRYERNKHIFVMAGSGAGKTFNFIGSNILQLNSSYVFTDPKGEILARYGNFFRRHGYKIKVVNIQNQKGFENSNRYNPMMYAKDETAIGDVVDLLMKNTSDDKAAQDFFYMAEKLVYTALLGYLFFMFKDTNPGCVNLGEMIDLFDALQIDPQTNLSEMDMLINGTTEEHGFKGFREQLIEKYGSEAAAKKGPEWFVVTNYNGFRATAGSPETIASIIASCYVRMRPFTIPAVRNMLATDELELDTIGTEKTALFIITSAQKGTYDFIAAMVLSHLFDRCVDVANALPGRHLTIPLCCYLDEVANIGQIPSLAGQVAFMRSYWVNLIIIVQSEEDLERAYDEKDRKSIRNNCDTTVYLGRDDIETCKKLSEELGMETVAYETGGRSRTGESTSRSVNVTYVQRPLMSADQIANELDGEECLIHIKQDRWYRDKKANPMNHPRWAELEATEPFDLAEWKREREEAKRVRRRVRMRGPRSAAGMVVCSPDMAQVLEEATPA